MFPEFEVCNTTRTGCPEIVRDIFQALSRPFEFEGPFLRFLRPKFLKKHRKITYIYNATRSKIL